jgi:hypothetical protein
MKQPARGRIEKPDEVENVVWQTRDSEPTDYENRLGDALEQAFADGALELGEVVERLNKLKFPDPDGRPWTEASFQAEMRRFGA